MSSSSALRICLAFAVLVGCAVRTSAQMTDEETIRSVRAASNAAIVGRDVAALRHTVTDDVNVTASSGSVFVGGDHMMDRFRASFEDPEFITYVRTPDEVTVSDDGAFAAEAGHWVGSWSKPDGEMRVRGTYMAQWQRRDGAWRIRSELFVALTCEGARACDARSP